MLGRRSQSEVRIRAAANVNQSQKTRVIITTAIRQLCHSLKQPMLCFFLGWWPQLLVYILFVDLWQRPTGPARWQQVRRREAQISSSSRLDCGYPSTSHYGFPCVLSSIHLFIGCLKHWHSHDSSHCHRPVFHWGQFIDQISAYSSQSISSSCEGFLLISVSLEMKKKCKTGRALNCW